MEFVKKNKGVIIFYLLLVFTVIAIINTNNDIESMNNGYVYLFR